MNHRQVEIFATVMRAGTASHAADLLGITQPAVSRAIADLEKSVRFSLFARIHNRLVPTPEARLFFRDVEASFRGLDTLRSSAAWIRDQGAGEIKIASLSALSSSAVPQAISTFQKKHADIRVTLHVLWSRDVRDRIASGQFDVGLAADEIDTSGIHAQPFATHRVACLMPKGHPLSLKEVIEPADLAEVPLVTYVPEDRWRQQLDAAFAAANVKPKIAVETTYSSTICSLVSQGIGVGFVSPGATGGADISHLVVRRFEPKIIVRVLLILPLDRQKSLLVREFIDCLLETRSAQPQAS
ncbi:LysR substrate-binding domain-containing protein [Kumtagia ephedrae]|jgi:DNA-binding transcriptional LysR family regulator|uniref:LysR family transcriptional regulator n=1 Tax=Kumtagia ephedrae TaxID=2116701 RepID=A0A2P7RVE3_9HYPH|nr:LysR substrate-binding domain-containing protein [Mesorhizobium ephedrae]PSJ54195.1 LysR family transcriptional regulator [Mesorhizobium ephedrae]